MPNDPLIEAITAGMFANLPDDCGLTPEGANTLAQAAIAALKAEGWMLCRWERSSNGEAYSGTTYFKDRTILYNADQYGNIQYKLVGIESPAAALVGRKDA